MAEIRHTFQTGKMNKDVDERIVPNGEYRDALNIQVVTSDDDDAGSAQLVSGTIERLTADTLPSMNPTTSWWGEKSTFVGSIANERTNKCYFFISSPSVGMFESDPNSEGGVASTKIFKDMIVEYDTVNKDIKPVVIDIFEVHLTASDLGITSADGNTLEEGYQYIEVASESKRSLIRPGMEVVAVNSSGQNQLSTDYSYVQLNSKIKVKRIQGTKVYFDRTLHGELTNATTWRFQTKPVLNFHRDFAGTSKMITGINIIEDMMFWTDNYSEPKKINIKRCKAGTSTFDSHTKLYISNPQNPDNLASLSSVDQGTDSQILEEHITVIRRAPRNAPKLEMSISTRTGSLKASISGQSFVAPEQIEVDGEVITEEGDPFEMGHEIDNVTMIGANYYVGDVLILTCVSDTDEPKVLRVKVVAVSGDDYDISIISADANCLATDVDWEVKLEQDRALFELKFGRFGYRYKYQDGEYSSFSPWSEIAFLGGAFDYVPIKGYNLGMVNNLRELKVTDFIVEDELRPDDVVSVDILYKDTTSPNCYIVKTIERGRHPEWNDASSGANSGVLNITSEMIHRTLPSSQILRAWDNVPRVARAQEITGNRVVYGNYLHNFDVPQPIIIEQGLKVEDHPGENVPAKSIKSIRKYKIGVVFGDKYGRETPVLGMGGLVDMEKADSDGRLKADVDNPKKYCHKKTKLTAKQRWSVGNRSYAPSDWMEYYKYYVKETTNDYYNLVMDRWYDAEDGNIWMSFQSADRNKLDEETYIVLKNSHGSQEPVLSEARYKILAIENEAPDYIKTTGKVLGTLVIPEGNGNSHAGIPTTMVIKFTENDYPSVFGSAKFKGIGWARIKGDNGTSVAFSKWVKVARMNNDLYTVTTVEPFGDSANMIEVLGGSVEYVLEVKDGVVENRPEFDGRFFVKVFKDATLKKFVMQETDDSKDFFTTYSFKHSFIASKTSNPAFNGPHASESWTAAGGDDEGWFNNNDNDDGPEVWNTQGANRIGMCGARQGTRHFWAYHGSSGFSGGATWFLDAVRYLAGNDKAKEKYRNHQGISSHNGVPYSRLSFSVNRQGTPSGGDDGQFKDLMMQSGTYFRFRNDPNKVVYEVKGSELTSGRNTQRKNTTNCKNCKGNPDINGKEYCHRRGFHVYFRQASNPNAGINMEDFDPRGQLEHNGRGHAWIDIVEPNVTYAENIRFTEGNAIWETEPKEDVGLDLYYEATNALPIKLEHANCEWFAPKLSPIEVVRPGVGTVFVATAPIVHAITRDVVAVRDKTSSAPYPFLISIGDVLKFKHDNGMVTSSKVLDHYNPIDSYDDTYEPSSTYTITISFTNKTATYTGSPGSDFNTSGGKVWEVIASDSDQHVPGTFITEIDGSNLTLSASNGSRTTISCTVKLVTGHYKLDPRTYLYSTELGWHNCYSFGNGLESDRIRDDFNAPVIDNGVKVSTTLDSYGEERRGSGMIWSGIYNSTSGVNELNEFNMAESITKDLNPSYGTLQALKTRDTNVVAFCEDKVFKILANKDALYNADGSSNVTASNAVLGDAKAFVGDYGISSNPESLAVDSYRMYFTDKQRGKVLRLSQDGLTPISDVGMTSWFRENLKHTWQLLGSFDEVKGEYNVSLQHTPDYILWLKSHREVSSELVTSPYDDTTVSFNEKSKGWVSFKSFIPQTGLSINGEYLTGAEGSTDIGVWSHHDQTVLANNFYGVQYDSTIDILFNDNPNVVKGFSSINYEGSQARIKQDKSDNQHYNLNNIPGWYVESIKTDQQEGNIDEFKNKEGKWFNHIFGEETTNKNFLTNLDTAEFAVQGLGFPISTTYVAPAAFTLTINANEGYVASNVLPLNDNYINMLQSQLSFAAQITGPVVLVNGTEITFDDTVLEGVGVIEGGSSVYNESSTGRILNSGLIAGTEVRLSGTILDRDNGNLINNTESYGHIQFRLNGDDLIRVFVDQNYSTALGNLETKIDGSAGNEGNFSIDFTLSQDYGKFAILPDRIQHTSSNDFGVRISNLKLETT